MGASESLEGYRVIEVSDNSPASEAGLKSYLDFIIAANGLKLSPNNTFQTIISKSKDCRVFLRVFNVMTQAMRDVVVVPREGWGGDGLMGATIRWEDCIEGNLLRIMNVIPGSKAEAAGLVALKEYVMGTQEETVTSIDRLAMLMRKSDSIVIFVYNSEEQNVRKICLETSGQTVGLELEEGMFHTLLGSSTDLKDSPAAVDSTDFPQETQQEVLDSSKPQENPSPIINPFSEPELPIPPAELSKLRPPPKSVSVSRSKTFKVGSPPGYLNNESTFHPVIFESSFISF